MNYLVTCTFDLKAASAADYQDAYAALKTIGLHKAIVSESGGSVVAPTTMTLGQFTGESAVSVRDSIRQRVKDAFAANHLRSEIFVLVSGDWAWGVATT